LNCAQCKQEPQNRCVKECFDCTGGKELPNEYLNSENKSLHNITMTLQKEYGNNLSRLDEIIKFLQIMQWNRVGIAFCYSLANEAEELSKILEKYFVIESVCCKVGGHTVNDFKSECITSDSPCVVCDPVSQAQILNKAKVDINIELGLCIGHDILFQKYSEAPVTVLAVKDRIFSHNPLGAIYSWNK